MASINHNSECDIVPIDSNGYKPSDDVLHIVLTSFEDGKPEIARVARHCSFDEPKTYADATEDKHENEVKQSIVAETVLDRMLNAKSDWRKAVKASADPDALLILGEIHSTLGFLPWHMRLTEI